MRRGYECSFIVQGPDGSGMLVAAPTFAQQPSPDPQKARTTVALLEKAAALVNSKGKVAFDEFRKNGTEWFKGETCLFAYDSKGNVLLNPAFPKRVGTNVSGQKDADSTTSRRSSPT
jgi:methyl-accepting chemotaxis protein